MAQPQPQVPQRTFSPASQLSPSPAPHPTAFSGQPPSKKPKLSPAPSPAGAVQSPSGIFSPIAANGTLPHSTNSPATPSTPNSLASPLALPSSSNAPPPHIPLPTPALPSSAVASPMPMPSPLPNSGQASNTASNGNSPHKLQIPSGSPAPQIVSPKPAQTPTPPTPSGPPTPSPQTAAPTNGNHFVPIALAATTPTQTSAVQTPTGGGGGGGAMGPPSKPPTKEYQYDVDDSLAGTGIDLRQEEQFQADYFAGTYRPEARTGFPANTPGRRASFYGSLSANQPAETIDEANQRKFELETAKHAWTDAARTLASSRSNALQNRFLDFGAVFLRADKIAKEYGIGVAMDPKVQPVTTGRARQEGEFPKPTVTVTTKKGPDGVSLVSTTSAFIPEDTFLADQLALLSLAAKHRLREILEDANKVAETRQSTSHGVVPDEWLEAAAPLPSAVAAEAAPASKDGDTVMTDADKNPLKRTLEEDKDLANVGKKIAAGNTLIQSLRVVSKVERSIEEQRLLKRQKREKNDAAAGAPATPTANRTATPGTPGSVAPEPEKAPTKKELKKNAAAKVAEQNDTLSANRTSMAFLGGRKKQYSWLSGGAGASPKRGLGGGGGAGGGSGGSGGAGGAGGSGASTPGRKSGEPAMLTAEGRTKWGSWREDGIKGKDIQLRDLVVVLEADGREEAALQTAYDKLDGVPLPPPKPAP